MCIPSEQFIQSINVFFLLFHTNIFYIFAAYSLGNLWSIKDLSRVFQLLHLWSEFTFRFYSVSFAI